MDLQEERRVLVACMLWKWSDHRNKRNAGDTVGTIDALSADIRYWTKESLQFCRNLKPQQQGNKCQVWEKLTTDILKLNMDGAFNEAMGRGGWGFVVRDSNADVRGTGAACRLFLLEFRLKLRRISRPCMLPLTGFFFFFFF